MEILPYHITIGNATDKGKVREHNEDYMAHFDTMLGYCIVVCDGMGGHAAGEVASQNAVDAIKYFLQNGKITKLDATTSLQNALEFANFKLREMVQQNKTYKGMGTTCVMALINKSGMFVAHAGDSRLYLMRNQEIRQVTKDHSTVQNLIDSGALTEDEAQMSDKKNEITKALGVFEKLKPTVTYSAIPLFYDDKILLCSDGLTTHVDKKTILEIITDNKDVQSAAMQLVEKANDAGGTDNITVQLIHFSGNASVPVKKRGKKKYLIAIIILIILIIVTIVSYWKVLPLMRGKSISPDTLSGNVTKGRMIKSLILDNKENLLDYKAKRAVNKKKV